MQEAIVRGPRPVDLGALETALSWPTIDSLVRTMAARDAATHRHARRVQRYALALAQENEILDVDLVEAIREGALLHDIGKLGIPDRLLSKPGPLTPREYEIVKQHAVLGADILAALACSGALTLIVRHHHENWDGSGYPDGLRGEAIPVGARVLSIVDCYDALTSDRPYRRELSHHDAVAMICERRGTMYDPRMVDAFLRTMRGVIAAPVTGHGAEARTSDVGALHSNPPWMSEGAAL